MDPAAGIGIAIGMTPRIGTAIGIAIGMTTGMAFGWGPTAGVQLPKLNWSSPCVLAGDGSTIPSEQATCFPGCGEKFRGSPPVARIKEMFHRVFTRALR